MTIVLVLGGARSGKSAWAEARARRFAGPPVYVATAEVGADAEMAARVAEHRARRGEGWIEVEAPLDLSGALRATDGAGPRLVDCLTLWLANVMFAERDWRAEAAGLAARLRAQASPVVLVGNELGAGVAPVNALARRFRDAHGELNQMIAEVADEATLVVAGLPLRLKG
jgi:adenosylcobinamide kinase/adenosylcobinamide-phosphate guanylyltransferase